MSKKVTKKKITTKTVKKKAQKTAKAKKKTLKANKPIKRTDKKTSKKVKQNSKKPKLLSNKKSIFDTMMCGNCNWYRASKCSNKDKVGTKQVNFNDFCPLFINKVE